MRHLSAEDILIIHSEIIDETGGLHGVRDVGLFAALADKPKAAFGGKKLYRDIFARAAVYLEAIANYHVFVDGNKRTAIAAAARFLFLNRYEFSAPNNEIVRFMVRVAMKKESIADIAAWLKRHSRKT
ncbi:type II toxin-antitoxin system death-on-curing family toxin [Candidatus Parcubacteria bacterium]|nr:MAG: type II toxin-antitoxin system death-on-curing family toxin [Candidatus Parcubacteria bacterium]